MSTDHEVFLVHLQSVFGQEDSIQVADAPDGGPPVCVFVYNDIPEPGMITGITYGLSLRPMPEWKFSRPEMLVSVNSTSIEWPCAAAAFAASFRGQKLFEYGDVFTTDGPLTSDTAMSGFLVFAQSILDEEVATVQLPSFKIHFSQFYPIYRQEVAIYEQIGLQAFWNHNDFDMYDIKRRPIRA